LFYKHNIEKSFELDPNLRAIPGSYGDFSHALLNIIINSIDALLDSPVRKLTIRSKYTEREIRLEVEDTGVGIALEDINKIFLPFFSTKNRHRKDGIPSGAGLGLAIARKVLEPYNVRFEVHSQMGSGTLMILHIPVEPADEVEHIMMESAEVNG
jgi:signal transduction histidine kinase